MGKICEGRSFSHFLSVPKESAQRKGNEEVVRTRFRTVRAKPNVLPSSTSPHLNEESYRLSHSVDIILLFRL